MITPLADFDFYATSFHGAADEATFTRLSIPAAAELDSLTFGRIDGDVLSVHEMSIKYAYCALIDAFITNENGGGIASESNDGVSVSYVAGVSKAKTDDDRIYDAAVRYLGNTGLLYRGR